MPSHTRLANEAWEALLQTHARLIKEFQAQDVWGELSMREYDVLYTLAKRSSPTPLVELTRHVLLSQPAISRLVDRLVSAGLVRRERDPHDGRGVLLSLTDAGREEQRRVGLRHGRRVGQALAPLDNDQLTELRRLLSGLAEEEAK